MDRLISHVSNRAFEEENDEQEEDGDDSACAGSYLRRPSNRHCAKNDSPIMKEFRGLLCKINLV